MPWPTITNHTASCCYQMCEVSGHTVCHKFSDYYERLCAAAQLVADDPANVANVTDLRAVLSEERGFIHE